MEKYGNWKSCTQLPELPEYNNYIKVSPTSCKYLGRELPYTEKNYLFYTAMSWYYVACHIIVALMILANISEISQEFCNYIYFFLSF